ncbi:hypothetical protein DACRYDRAFT_110688 [Dacryopinax primogenitus]|uniref:Uncharacterized protein n=1 Tax=Dacryopinax primogenitus (strain DJM 731) TaxID=1858805 RepID=M5FPV0_DACPD|nr:uncharacterized protein DACRYDRAFT_110688 [Dacryopinax primogenitus]EJT98795.1 hypothetical protein DACRYDRAFT_110688 [Dacryopinax primogenitus]
MEENPPQHHHDHDTASTFPVLVSRSIYPYQSDPGCSSDTSILAACSEPSANSDFGNKYWDRTLDLPRRGHPILRLFTWEEDVTHAGLSYPSLLRQAPQSPAVREQPIALSQSTASSTSLNDRDIYRDRLMRRSPSHRRKL